MKNFIFAASVLLILLNACKTKTVCNINGKVEGVNISDLRIAGLDTSLHIDTILKIVDGKFNYTVNLKEPTPLVMSIKETGEIAFVFIENGDINITAKSGQFDKLKLTGSKTNEQFAQYQNTIAPLMERGRILTAKGDTAKTQESMDLIIAEANELDSLQGNSIIDFIKKNSNSAVSSFLVFTQLDRRALDFESTNKYYSLLKGEALNTFFGKKLTENINKIKNLSVGSEAPDFTLVNVYGKAISLKSLRGKYVLIDFWASWCKPCREENPNVVAAYQQFKDKNFNVLGVSLDDDNNKWKDAIKKDGLTWNHVSDLKGWASSVVALYNIGSIPSNVLIDNNGKIIALNLRGEALINKLNSILK